MKFLAQLIQVLQESEWDNDPSIKLSMERITLAHIQEFAVFIVGLQRKYPLSKKIDMSYLTIQSMLDWNTLSLQQITEFWFKHFFPSLSNEEQIKFRQKQKRLLEAKKKFDQYQNRKKFPRDEQDESF